MRLYWLKDLNSEVEVFNFAYLMVVYILTYLSGRQCVLTLSRQLWFGFTHLHEAYTSDCLREVSL